MDKPAEAFISYMATSFGKFYPLVKFSVGNGNNHGVTINPNFDTTAYPFPVHLVQMKSIEYIMPGDNFISIQEVENGRDPFRIVGVMVTTPLSQVDALVESK